MTSNKKCKFCGQEFPYCQTIYLPAVKIYVCEKCYSREFYQKPYEEQQRRELTPQERTTRDIVLEMLWEERCSCCQNIELCHESATDATFFRERLTEVESQIDKMTKLEDLPAEKRLDSIEDWFIRYLGRH